MEPKTQDFKQQLLSIENYCLTLKGSDNRILPVVQDVSFTLDIGSCLAIAGESGSGKSVLAMSIVGLIRSSIIHKQSGQIYYNNTPLVAAKQSVMQDIRGKNVGFIFQEPMTAMNPLMTLYSQVAETIEAHLPSLKKEQVEQKVKKALLNSGFNEPEKFYHSYPHQLSGGMRQRAMIAIALAMEPELIIADEPTTAIDAAVQVQLLKNLKEKLKTNKHGMIFISHDLGVLQAVSDYLAIMYCGHLVELGKSREILINPAHPYSADLISALPRLSKQKTMPKPIKGTMPAPDKKPVGCVYSDRCQRAQEQCVQDVPQLIEVRDGRKVKCFYPLCKETR